MSSAVRSCACVAVGELGSRDAGLGVPSALKVEAAPRQCEAWRGNGVSLEGPPPPPPLWGQSLASTPLPGLQRAAVPPLRASAQTGTLSS